MTAVKQRSAGSVGSAALGEIKLPKAQGASGFMVGISPICGLPVAPWAVAIFMAESEVVPQQSFLGQKKRVQLPQRVHVFFFTAL
jgi:hypothetical protein